MRKIDLEQGSDAWLLWRKSVLTATDASVIMGVSPYDTPYKLWQKKMGLGQEPFFNSAMARGVHDEPIARRLFMEKTGVSITPVCIESDNYPILGASLDGISDCGKYSVEIKSNGDQYHFALRSSGEIPDFHWIQMQHQMMCMDGKAEKGYYVSYNKGDMIIKEVEPDTAWMEKYLEKANQFWSCLVFSEPPAPTSRDYKDMTYNPVWASIASEYRITCEEIKVLEAKKEKMKEQLIEIATEESSAAHGIKLLKKSVKGRVDYDLVPELKGINLDKYRKPTTNVWSITLDK